MTLLEFIKSKLFDKSELGKLANEIVNDPDFPAGKPEREINGYLVNKSAFAQANPKLRRILKEFKRITNTGHNDLYNIEKYVVL